jgi:hypothetical protein
VTTAEGRARLRRVPLTMKAWLALCAFDLLRWRGFSALHASVRRLRTARRRHPPSTADVVWAVDEACVWYVKRVACLQRSAVTTWLLRRHGIHGELIIGYRAVPFESHAWVEVNGAVVNDLAQYQSKFTVLDRL